MRKWLYIAVFTSGLTSLAVEMAASRLLGNYFGSSNLTWAAIIGLILIYLTIGYFLGGYWADKSPHQSTFYKILAWGAFTITFVPVVAQPVLRAAANAFDNLELGVLFGSFMVVMILFVVPVTLLGTASPFAIRLAISDSRQAGSIAGRIYAISTLGSFVGTFLPVLILIPTIGTYRTFIVLGGILLLVALAALWSTSGWKMAVRLIWMPIIVGILLIYGARGASKTSAGLVFETDSAYNYIQVLEVGETRLLRLNDGQGVHSIYNPTQTYYNGPWEQVLVAPFFNPAPVSPADVTSLAIVGLAAGTTARQADLVFPNIQMEGIEIDPEIVEVGQRYFEMTMENLHVTVQDGRWALENNPNKFQVISVDAYRPPYIPWHLTTREFFTIVRDHLTEDGVLVINIGRTADDRRLIETLASTIQSVFPSVHVMDLPDSFNSILFATMQPTVDTNLTDNFLALSQNPDTPLLLLEAMASTINNLQPVPSGSTVFTDDWAPIEWITNDMIFDFFTSGSAEILQ